MLNVVKKPVCFVFQERPPYQVEKKEIGVPEVGVSEEGVCCRKKGNWCARGWCIRRASLLQHCLPVKFNM